MTIERFIAVGENIHCTRIYKVGGEFCREIAPGRHGIRYRSETGTAWLPVPARFVADPDWRAGRVKHCQVAIRQSMEGDPTGAAAGRDYLLHLARAQEAAGAAYLDVNVDEYSTDLDERARVMTWLVGLVQEAVSIPVSVDSSNMAILEAGLKAANPARGRPMVNSVSLERPDAIALAARYRAVVIASAAGRNGLPSTREERLDNIARVVALLREAGLSDSAIHVDPLVFPISTDSRHGIAFLDTVADVRRQYGPDVHIVAGLSNVSFGMPNRKLINQVFAWLAVKAGADGGIVDPAQINSEILRKLDPSTEPFQLARALLTGEDDYGVEFIAAAREGRLGN